MFALGLLRIRYRLAAPKAQDHHALQKQDLENLALGEAAPGHACAPIRSDTASSTSARAMPHSSVIVWTQRSKNSRNCVWSIFAHEIDLGRRTSPYFFD